MGFQDRASTAEALVTAVKKHIWLNPPFKGRMLHVPFGYETHIDSGIRTALRFVYEPTARYIRFAPDFCVVDVEHPESAYLLEYKAYLTPIAYETEVNRVREAANDPTITSTTIGQWEELAYDNYRALHSIGVRVAILNYVPHHPRPVLCEFIENVRPLRRYMVGAKSRTGSGTPYVNVGLESMRTLGEFLCQEHEFDAAAVESLVRSLAEELLRDMPVRRYRVR